MIFKTILALSIALCVRGDVKVTLHPDKISKGYSSTLKVSSKIRETCSYSLSSNDKVTTVGTDPSTKFTVDHLKDEIINITAINNSLTGSKIDLLVTVICGSQNIVKHLTIYSNNEIVDEYPQFIQNIIDYKQKTIRTICYDVKGYPGERIQIYEHNESKTYLSSQLVTDKLSNVVNIISKANNVSITVDNVAINDQYIFDWEGIKDLTYYRQENLLFYNKFNAIQVQSTDSLSFGGVSFIIERRRSLNNDYFLNIKVEGLDNYKGVGGILGEIGNQRFEFHLDDENKGAIIINGRMSTGQKIMKDYSHCLLLNIKDILYPNSL